MLLALRLPACRSGWRANKGDLELEISDFRKRIGDVMDGMDVMDEMDRVDAGGRLF